MMALCMPAQEASHTTVQREKGLFQSPVSTVYIEMVAVVDMNAGDAWMGTPAGALQEDVHNMGDVGPGMDVAGDGAAAPHEETQKNAQPRRCTVPRVADMHMSQAASTAHMCAGSYTAKGLW